MPAETGAIYQIRDPAGHACGAKCTGDSAGTGVSSSIGGAAGARNVLNVLGHNLTFITIDDEKPADLCGSGIVDLIACLVESGKLTSRGRFAPDVSKDGIVFLDRERRLVLTKKDVDIFQRAKGAIAAAIGVLLSMARMRCADLHHIYVGGAFGHFLNKANAVSIGLLPDVGYESIQLCGNTALAGCEQLLMLPDSIELLKRIRARARIVNLAQSTGV